MIMRIDYPAKPMKQYNDAVQMFEYKIFMSKPKNKFDWIKPVTLSYSVPAK